MGAKASKSELKRSKSFKEFGRSSQRDFLRKSQIKLDQINKKLKKFNVATDADEIKIQLHGVESDLKAQNVKDKHTGRYEKILTYLQETRKKFEEKLNLSETPEVLEAENVKKTVELKLVRVSSVEDLDEEDEVVEIRKPLEKNENEMLFRAPSSPKVKFGVQVMPIMPRVSQELLRRRTLPINEAPKAEFEHIRSTIETGLGEGKENSVTEINELYDHHVPTEFESHINFDNQIDSTAETKFSFPSPNSEPKKVQLLNERQVNADALEQIELVTKDIDVLEDKLKYFTGIKGDDDYIELQERFVRCLIKLDDVDIHGDPVARQERKISIQRIQELLKILAYLVEPKEEMKQESKHVEDADGLHDYIVGQTEANVNPQGTPVASTAL